MRQEGWPAAPSEAQPPLRCWRSDASTETGVRGCRKTPPIDCDMLLTIKDLSRWLNIKPSPLYLRAAQGRIPSQKIYGLVRFEREKVTEWLDSFERKSVESMPRASRASHRDLDRIIEAAKRDAYTPPPGKPSTASPKGREVDRGAR
ncbi:MAG: helix-turn-helix domain-containing protein [Nitrospira sp.]|nr:helix-turn-helix domain-containing protein [Nitrospira sp.]MDH4250961.1 helix-turn-helix domain-containing protein [Nitrospira sp.]MDH4342975.1 helix-turn-helix domain-containing protein [Nitrospira sp.]MDH5336634.1 helix-turn-helix domain-containing protein [Nitrospira sp.]